MPTGIMGRKSLTLIDWGLQYPASSWFLLRQRERNHCGQPSAFPSSMRDFVTPHVMHLMSISFEEFVQKNASLSPKALAKPSSKYCLYLVCGLHMKPKFEAFLPSLVRDCSARTTQHSKGQLFETIQVWGNTIESRFL